MDFEAAPPALGVLASAAEQRLQLHYELRHSDAAKTSARPVHDPFPEPLARRFPMDFDLLLRRENQPDLLHARVGVGGYFGAVVLVTGDTYLNHQFSRGRMFSVSGEAFAQSARRPA